MYLCYSFRSAQQLASVLPYFDAHYIAHNFLHVAFVTFCSRSEFLFAEVALILDLFQLFALHLYHCSHLRLTLWIRGFLGQPTNPSVKSQWDRSIISGPLSWVVVALFWNGAMVIPQREGLAASIVGNIFIWVICVTGVFCGIVYKVRHHGRTLFVQLSHNAQDCTMTMCLSFLSAAIGVGQYRLMDGSSPTEHSIQLIPLLLQCAFAFIIMAWLFIFTLALVLTRWLDSRQKAEPELGPGKRPGRDNCSAAEAPVKDVEMASVEPKRG